MRFGRQDELEADHLGVRFGSEAGYDPRSMIALMKILEESSQGNRPPEFFSTHPNPENRIQRIEAADQGTVTRTECPAGPREVEVATRDSRLVIVTSPLMELLRNAELYAPEPRGRAHLLIAGESVVWIGAEAPALPRALGVVERDLDGRRVIPGLIDGHVHLTGGGGEAGPETRVPPVMLSRLTGGGVTTAVGVLGTDDTVRSPAELVTTARGLIAEGLSAFCYTGGYHFPPVTVTGSVRQDIVLIDLILGVGELAISDHRSSQPSLDELLRVAADAHVGGLMSGKAGIVHLHVGDGDRGLELVRQALETE